MIKPLKQVLSKCHRAPSSEKRAALEWFEEVVAETLEITGQCSDEMILHVNTIRAALQRQDVPHGFVMVPIEPTQEMLSNTTGMDGRLRVQDFLKDGDLSQPYFMPKVIYRAMITAAPKPTGGMTWRNV